MGCGPSANRIEVINTNPQVKKAFELDTGEKFNENKHQNRITTSEKELEEEIIRQNDLKKKLEEENIRQNELKKELEEEIIRQNELKRN